MSTKSHTLAVGIVPIFQSSPDNLYLLLRAYSYWDFPKGTLEHKEDPLQGALRELKEETGITQVDFKWGLSYKETVPYGQNKIARYYLGIVPQEGVYLPVSAELGRPEHHEFRWVNFKEARSLVVPRLREILDWAKATIEEKSL